MTPSAPSSDEVSNLAAALGGLTDPAAQRARLAAALPLPAETRAALAQALKQQADRLVRADIQQARRVAELLRALGELANDPACTALGLRALGNVHALGLGEFAEGLACYDAAAAIYGRLGDELQEAQSQIGKIYALSNLGEYDAALAVGRWASEVFERHAAWPALAGLLTNVAILHGRISQDAAALAQLDRAAAICQRLGADAQPLLLTIRLNRAILLRNLGRFDDSIADLEAAWAGYRALGETESAARARQNLALTYFVLGRYNEALQLLDEARQVFLEDGRLRHAMLVELFVSNCLLQLRRFDEVLDKAPQIRALFAELGASFEVGQALLNEATAHMGLAQPEAALAALAEARAIFAAEGNAVAAADA
ncbi:MAG: tetratricopeptide repeat protein, partial [Anaerolineales bacterium]|nr:tetratricopeptide repeat protein [Anaerolineales bacterium]